jgi:hypothetical protein
MVAYVFDRILTTGEKQGILPHKTLQARNWFRAQASKVAMNPNALMAQDRSAMVTVPMIGQMYLFAYDPKTKDKLPYYDRYPLVIPFDSKRLGGRASGSSSSQGFMGLNMHYLPLRLRARLMDALYTVISDENYDERTHLQISYDLLSSVTRYRFYKPCIKQYLFSNVRTKFFRIDPKSWDIALFMPLERFSGASTSAVHRDSYSKVQ